MTTTGTDTVEDTGTGTVEGTGSGTVEDTGTGTVEDTGFGMGTTPLFVKRTATLALLAVVLAAAGCGTRAEGANRPAEVVIPVQVVPVVQADGGARVSATGTLGAKDEVTLSFKIGGIVGTMLVDDGARVRRGQVLAALDQREIDAVVAKATAGADKARRDAVRVERLFRDSVATLAQFQDAQTARDAAEADLRAARVNHEYATIVAPADGVVLARMASAGQMLATGAPVIQFASRGRGSVLRAGIPDRDAVRVAIGDAATVTFDAVPGRTFKGRVSQVGAAADARTGLFVVEIALDGVQALPSGLVGRVVISPRNRGRQGQHPAPGATSGDVVYSVPAEALVEGDQDGGTLYTVDAAGTRARRVNVTLVALAGDRVLVRGLGGVTRVVRNGAHWLSDSARVEIKP